MKFIPSDGVYLIASPVTFAEALEHCWNWACHRYGVGEAFILVIYSSISLHVTVYLSDRLLHIISGSSGHPSIQLREETKQNKVYIFLSGLMCSAAKHATTSLKQEEAYTPADVPIDFKNTLPAECRTRLSNK